MPSDFALKGMNTVHRILMKASFNKFGWTAAKMPVVELTTTGRKSGRLHTVLLTSPIQVGDTYVIVASRGGDDHHPAWYLNLCAEPKVEAAIKGGPKLPMTARVATADERAEWWPKIIATYKNYGAYQTKTSREIPLVALEPAN